MQKDIEHLMAALHLFQSHESELKEEQVPVLIESLKQRLDVLNKLYEMKKKKDISSEHQDFLEELTHVSHTYPPLKDFLHESIASHDKSGDSEDGKNTGEEEGAAEGGSKGSKLAQYFLAPIKNTLWRVKRISFFR